MTQEQDIRKDPKVRELIAGAEKSLASGRFLQQCLAAINTGVISEEEGLKIIQKKLGLEPDDERQQH